MATLLELAESGALMPYEADLEDDEWADRTIYVTPSFNTWMDNVLPTLPKDRGRKLTPQQQIWQTFFDFITGKPFFYPDDRRRLTPDSEYVWELKTEDLRVFGWFPEKGKFIAVTVEMKKNLRSKKLYEPFIDDVITFRSTLSLDEPKSLTGVKADEIL